MGALQCMHAYTACVVPAVGLSAHSVELCRCVTDKTTAKVSWCLSEEYPSLRGLCGGCWKTPPHLLQPRSGRNLSKILVCPVPVGW
jgi:hypothetical protein